MKTYGHILVVDDEPRNRSLLTALLRSLNYTSIAAEDGDEAISQLSRDIDLILLDVMMPGMDGFETTRKIRSIPEFADIPVIMVTVLNSKKDRLEAVEAGANDFITKPIDKLELQTRVASLLRMKRAQDEIKQHQANLELMVRERTDKLRASEERLRGIFEAAQDGIFVQDTDLRYTHVNPAMSTLFDLAESNLIGSTDEDIFGHDVGKHDRQVAARVLAGETVEEERTRRVGGAENVFLETRTPMKDQRGRITGICGIIRNITDRKIVQLPRLRNRLDEIESPVMRKTLHTALLVADTDSTVLLLGESGVGKDYLARYIHEHSKRSSGPFFAINCAAVAPELAESELFGHEAGAFTGAQRKKRGLLELAEGGTLLLNEIGELSLPLQAKLLSFLDTMTFSRVGGEKTVRVSARLIAATNRDLTKEVEEKKFRADLFYRLNVYSMRVPPLRDRIQDLPVLTKKIIALLGLEMQLEKIPELDSASLDILSSYNWPGNVRELRNVLERSLILSRGKPFMVDLQIKAKDAPPKTAEEIIWSTGFPLQKSLMDLTLDLRKTLIEHALEKSRGRRVEAARLLNITRDSLKRQMKTLGFYDVED